MIALLACLQDPSLLERIEAEWTAVAARARAAVVEVRSGERRLSGVVVRADGYILTDASGLGPTHEVSVVFPDERRDAAVEIFVDGLTGLAVIRIDAADLKPIAFAERAPEPGAPILVCGNPFGIGKSVVGGTVAATGRHVRGRRGAIEDLVQIAAPAFPGDGGALVADVRGEIAGIIVAGAGLSEFAAVPFAVPADVAKYVTDALIAHGEVKRGWLGVIAREPSEALCAQLGIASGAVVDEVARGGPADGILKQHDVLTRLNGEPIADLHSLRMAIWRLAEGETVKVEFLRRQKLREIELKVGRIPEE